MLTDANRRRLAVAIGILLAVACARPGPAARENLSRYPVATVRVVDHGGELGTEFRYYRERQSLSGGGKVDFRNMTFQEYFQYRARGYVYHPRFLDYRAMVKVGFAQQRIRRSTDGPAGDESFRSNEFLNAYDLYLKFFQEHPFSFDVFANRDERPILGLFTDTQMITSESQGAIARWNNRVAPMDWSFTRSTIERSGVDSESTTQYETFEYNIRHELRNSRSRLRYRHQEFEQDFRARTPFLDIDRRTELDSDDIDFLNTLYLTGDKRTTLTSSIRYFQQRGTTEFETFSWSERLRIQLTDRLSTYAQGSYLRNSTDTSTVETFRGEAGVDHLLYESLRSHFNIHWRQTQFDDSEETQAGVTGRLDYRKRTGWGVLTAGVGATLDQISREGGTGTRPIFDEEIVIVSGTTHFLANADVVRDSIIVTDPTGTIVYVENFDYEVIVIGRRTGIRLLPGGILADGDTVHVDYRFVFSTDIEYHQLDTMVHARHDFTHLVPGLALYASRRDVNPGGLDDEEEDRVLELTDQMAGVRYRWRWLTWTEEYQQYRSNFGDYDQFRSRLEGSHRLNNRLRWGWNIGYDVTEYSNGVSDVDDTSKFLFAGTTLNGSFLQNGNGYWTVEARGSQETGRTDRTIFGVLGRVGVQWRKMRVEGGARFEQFDVFDSKRDRLHAFVQVARTF